MDLQSQTASVPLDSGADLHFHNETILGKVYYHTMMIYLPAMFTPSHKIWHNDTVRSSLPFCTPAEVDVHVQAILEHAEVMLQQSTLAGILLYLPMRVAGQRCASHMDRTRVQRIISQIADRGFVAIKSLLPAFARLWS
jgi:primosomal replication protein N